MAFLVSRLTVAYTWENTVPWGCQTGSAAAVPWDPASSKCGGTFPEELSFKCNCKSVCLSEPVFVDCKAAVGSLPLLLPLSYPAVNRTCEAQQRPKRSCLIGEAGWFSNGA